MNITKILKKILLELRDRKKRNFNRVMPLSELISDRWEKSNYLKFGKGSSIYDLSYVFGDVKVGENTWVGPFTILDGSGGLEIGDNCSISAGVQIYSHESVQWAVSGGTENYNYQPTQIGNNVYIGPNCVISMGVIIGDHTIIGANSFVNKSYPANSKIAGNPAKPI